MPSCRVYHRNIRARRGGIEYIDELHGAGHHTVLALRRKGYDTLNKLAKADLDDLAEVRVGRHRTRLGREKAKKLKRQAARAK